MGLTTLATDTTTLLSFEIKDGVKSIELYIASNNYGRHKMTTKEFDNFLGQLEGLRAKLFEGVIE